MKRYMYVFLRTDIPFVNQIVQAGHACTLAGRDFQIPDDTNLVLLEVENESKLVNAARWLEKNKINYRMFYEPDFPVGNTAIATGPICESLKPLFRGFKLRRISLIEFVRSLIKHDS